MKLAEVSVKRPVFAIMMTAALIILGAFSYKDLGLDLMPKTDSPNVNVQVQLPGASAEEVEPEAALLADKLLQLTPRRADFPAQLLKRRLAGISRAHHHREHVCSELLQSAAPPSPLRHTTSLFACQCNESLTKIRHNEQAK